jgi:hypothetical protein
MHPLPLPVMPGLQNKMELAELRQEAFFPSGIFSERELSANRLIQKVNLIEMSFFAMVL